MVERKLDWVSQHDERSRKHDIRSVLSAGVPIQKKMWDEGIVLDQGSEGACVGFGWTGEYLSTPAPPAAQPRTSVAETYAKGVYVNAKLIDEFSGENYEGTSVLAGAKVMQSRGIIESYRWAFDLQSIRDAIIQEGPVVIGIPWKEGMYDTAPGGIVKVSGKLVGGHCLILTGYDPAMKIGSRKYEVYRWRNSWGSSYGVGGSGYIKATDLDKLLKSTGEACIPMGRKTPPVFGSDVSKKSFLKVIGEKVLTWTKR